MAQEKDQDSPQERNQNLFAEHVQHLRKNLVINWRRIFQLC